ncbi:unnamed protein product [Amoebophrya sp. A120]|nr:unnamed protein product [Amoebophrya sp. A120]|eukprot:GSA120T00005401001.1
MDSPGRPEPMMFDAGVGRDTRRADGLELGTVPRRVDDVWVLDEAEHMLVDTTNYVLAMSSDTLASLFDMSPFRTARLYSILHAGGLRKNTSLSPWEFSTLLKRVGLVTEQRLEGVQMHCPDSRDPDRWLFYHWCHLRREQNMLRIPNYPRPTLPETVYLARDVLKPINPNFEGDEAADRGLPGLSEGTDLERARDFYWQISSRTGLERSQLVRSVYAIWTAFAEPFLDRREQQMVMLPQYRLADVLRYASLRALLMTDDAAIDEEASAGLAPGEDNGVSSGFLVIDYTADMVYERRIVAVPPRGSRATKVRRTNSVGHLETQVQHYEIRDFFLSPQHMPSDSPMKMRWIAFTMGRGKQGKSTVLRLAVKYRIHPLAVEDALSLSEQAPSGRITRYDNRLSDLIRLTATKSLDERAAGRSPVSGGGSVGFWAPDDQRNLDSFSMAMPTRASAKSANAYSLARQVKKSGRLVEGAQLQNKSILSTSTSALDAEQGDEEDEDAAARAKAKRHEDQSVGEHWFVSVPLFRLSQDSRQRMHSALATLERLHGNSKNHKSAIDQHRGAMAHTAAKEKAGRGSFKAAAEAGRQRLEAAKSVFGGSKARKRHTRHIDTGIQPNLGIEVESSKLGLIVAVRPTGDLVISIATPWHQTRVNMTDEAVKKATEEAKEAAAEEARELEQEAQKNASEGSASAKDTAKTESGSGSSIRHVKKKRGAESKMSQAELAEMLLDLAGDLSEDDFTSSDEENDATRGNESEVQVALTGAKKTRAAQKNTRVAGLQTTEEEDDERERRSTLVTGSGGPGTSVTAASRAADLVDEEDAEDIERAKAAMAAAFATSGPCAETTDRILYGSPVANERNEARRKMAAADRKASAEAQLLEDNESDAERRTTERKAGGASASHKPKIINALKRVKKALIKDYSVIRHGDAIWLLYCILDSCLTECLPIAHAFELQLATTSSRLHQHEHALPEQEVKNLYLIERHLDWLEMELKPFERVLKSLVENFEDRIPAEVRGYLEDVQDSLLEMMDKLSCYQRECESLKAERQSYVDSSLNRLLTVLTIITAAALPATMISGYAGMNFETADEENPGQADPTDPWLTWEYGWESYFIITGSFTLLFLYYIIVAARGLL